MKCKHGLAGMPMTFLRSLAALSLLLVAAGCSSGGSKSPNAPVPALKVTKIDANTGSIYGGFVIIIGEGFVDPSVTFGGTPGTVVSVGSTSSFSVDVPAHAAGAVDVVVTISGGASFTVANGYTYVAPVQLNNQNWQIDLTYFGGDFRVGADMILNKDDLTGDVFYSSGGTNYQVYTEGRIFGDSISVTFTLDKDTPKEASFTCVGKLFRSSPQVFKGNFTSGDNGPICGGVTPCVGSFEIK